MKISNCKIRLANWRSYLEFIKSGRGDNLDRIATLAEGGFRRIF